MSQLDMNQLLTRLLGKVADLGAEADIIANQEKAFSSRQTRASWVNTRSPAASNSVFA